MAPAAQWKAKSPDSDKPSAKGKAEDRGGGGEEKGQGKQKGGGKGETKGASRENDWFEEVGGGKKGKALSKGGRKGGKGGSREAPIGDGRSPLSGTAPSFEPSSSYEGYGGYEESYWSGWQQPAPLPLWREFADPDGTPYYYNSKTGLCQWDRPSELEPPKPTPSAASESAAEGGMNASGEKGSREDRGPRGGGDRLRGGDREGEARRASDGDRGGKGNRSEAQPPGGQRRDRDADAGEKGRGRRRKPEDDAKKKGADKDAAEFGPPGCNLFVFHLPDDWTDDDLHEYFAPHGNVISAKVMKELGTGRSRGFGFVSYEDRVSAATAIKKMQGYKILGKRLKVEFKKGEGESSCQLDDDEEDEAGGGKKHFPDDERLIGYLRAISAKNVVQSLKESEGAARDDEPPAAEEDDM